MVVYSIKNHKIGEFMRSKIRFRLGPDSDDK